jgi:hypothetical protein
MTRSHFMLIALLLGSVTLFGCDGGGAAGAGGGNSGGDATGASGGSGGSGGGTGATGGGSCTDAATQCPPGGECVVPTCNNGSCASSPVAAGTPTANGQSDGDCRIKVCDGMGATELVDDDTDTSDDGNECTKDTCVAGENVSTPIGGSCDDDGGVVCANPAGPKAGQCVMCNSDSECPAPKVCNVANGSHACVNASCMDGTKNGPETDVDCGGACGPCQNGLMCAAATDCQSAFCDGGTCKACGSDTDCPPADFCDTGANGGTCAADQSTGEACSAAGQCTSGFCVDNVCCATACAGACSACSAAKKGQGDDGACGSIAAGSDPDNECAADPVSTCDKSGACDGAGACAIYAPMTVCQPQSCMAGVMSTPDLCDGAGTCIDSGSTSCGDYACNAATLMCHTSCQNDSQCAPALYCNGGSCLPKLTLGSACNAAGQCASGFCADSVCCDTACAGACKACNLAPGTCTNTANDSDPANECAGAYSCNGAGACQACGDGVQQAGEQCDDGNMMNGDGCESNCTSLANPLVVCVNPNLAITGAGPGAGNPSVINIPASVTITDVNMSINCNHTWPGDLVFTLSHGATSRTVYDRPGVPTSTYGCETDDILVTLDDEGAGGALESVCSLTVPGINSPPSRVPNNLLSGFDGQNAQGNWNLVVTDAYSASDDGLLTQWCLNITWQ